MGHGMLSRSLQLLAFLGAACLSDGAPPDPATHPADTWPRFRGHDGDGIASGFRFPEPWSEEAIRWKVDLPGAGHSSPVVWKDRVFITSGDAASGRRILSCLDAKDGRELWRREFDSQVHRMHRDNSYASSTPAADGRAVFMCWTTPEEATVVALDHAGKELWRTGLGAYKSQHGGGTSPVCLGDVVAIGNDQDGASSLIGLDAATGKARWRIERTADKTAFSTPCVRRTAGGQAELIFTSTSHGITAIDPKTGKMSWEMADAFPLRVVGSPMLADGLVVATCGTGGIGRRLVAVAPGGGAAKGSLAYEMPTPVPYVPTPVEVQGLLFLWGDKGSVSCLRAKTGEKIWAQQLDGTFYGSPVCAGDRLFCISKEGTLFVIAAGDKFQPVATVPLGERSFATPAIAGGTMFLRTETRLVAVGSK